MGILIAIAIFIGMEAFSWAFHKYVMHGLLWNIHKTHHVHTKGLFELNDVFSLLFGTVAVILIVLGANSLDYRFWIGIGISSYGLAYFILHDMLIHKRIKGLKKARKGYLRAITIAHRDHHKSRKKSDGVSFGLFVVPRKYFRN